MVEAAGVERDLDVIGNPLMARDFWSNTFRLSRLRASAVSTVVLRTHLGPT